MASEKLKIRFQEIEKLAHAAGLDHYEVQFFEVPAPIIWQTAAYGLPTRYSHWSFGRHFQNQKMQAEMGFSKIYELILNSSPGIAYLDKTNTDTINLLIAAHCFGHAHFFKNNILFKKCNETNMVDVSAQHAAIIDQFRNDYGDDEVDDWLDVALSLEHHIDEYKGRRRKPYSKRHVVYKENKRMQWDDLLDSNKLKPLVEKIIEGNHIPPHPEKDILWFLIEYANIESWQKKIFEIVRRESYYFFPQFKTKIINEGWASYWHAEIMSQYALGNDNDLGVRDIEYPLTSEEHLDFVTYHEKVVQPGFKIRLKTDIPYVDPQTGRSSTKKVNNYNSDMFRIATRINPYYIGFRIFRDIKERWDNYFEQGYLENEWGEKIPVKINGNQKIFQVAQEEDDVSFMRHYLTEDLANDLHLFTYGNNEKYKDTYEIQEDILDRNESNELDSRRRTDSQIIENRTVKVRSKEIKDIVSVLAKSLNNYGVPDIVIRRVDESGLMRLEHLSSDNVNLDIKYAENVIKYIYKVWRRPVEIIRKSKDRTYILNYDGINFDINHESSDYPEVIEKTDVPSSW